MPGLSTIKLTTTSIERRSLKSIENVSNIFPSTSKACQLLGPEQNIISIPAPTVERKKGKESIFPENKISSEVCHKDAIQIKQKTDQALKKTTFLRSKMTKTENELYLKLVYVKMKLSKCRNKSKKQAAELKTAKKLFTNIKFIKALENIPSTGRLITLMQFRENNKKEKGRRFSTK